MELKKVELTGLTGMPAEGGSPFVRALGSFHVRIEATLAAGLAPTGRYKLPTRWHRLFREFHRTYGINVYGRARRHDRDLLAEVALTPRVKPGMGRRAHSLPPGPGQPPQARPRRGMLPDLLRLARKLYPAPEKNLPPALDIQAERDRLSFGAKDPA